MAVLDDLANAVITGDEQNAPKLVQQALDEGMEAKKVLEEGLQGGMAVIGRRFRENEIFIPEVLIAAEAMKAGMAVLRPRLTPEGVEAAATAVIGTVKGDLHDIGKNLVGMMLEGAGFEVVDLGVDISAEKFVAACKERPVQLVGMSALLTTTMPEMENVVKRIRDEIDPVPVILVGGAPITQDYADKIGADGYGRDAASGAILAKERCVDSAA